MSEIIGFIPQDNRPVSFLQPIMLAELAGFTILAPPTDWLGEKRTAGDSEKIGSWLVEHANETEGWVISLDMLAYGGLVPSREIRESLETSFLRLEFLSTAKKKAPKVPFFAFQAIRRLSTTVFTDNDLRKWETFHNQANIPSEFRSRNHAVNMKALEYCDKHILDLLLLLQEDAKVQGPQIREQVLLDDFAAKRKLSSRYCMTTGTDEGAAVLIARLINRLQERDIRAHLIFSSTPGAERVALYEDRPIRESVAGQARALGLETTENGKPWDFELFVWCPDRPQKDLFFEPSVCGDSAEIDKFVRKVQMSLEAGRKVVIADLAYANGSDHQLCRELARSIDLSSLTGYSAWNTAANAAGHSLVQGALSLANGPRKLAPSMAFREHTPHGGNSIFLALRFLEDWGYQAVIRSDMLNWVKNDLKVDVWDISSEKIGDCEKRLHVLMSRWNDENLARHFPKFNWIFSLPWKRIFEIGILPSWQERIA